MLSTILIVVLILLLVGALPTWPYSSGWGYYPGGGLGLVLIIVIDIWRYPVRNLNHRLADSLRVASASRSDAAR